MILRKTLLIFLAVVLLAAGAIAGFFVSKVYFRCGFSSEQPPQDSLSKKNNLTKEEQQILDSVSNSYPTFRGRIVFGEEKSIQSSDGKNIILIMAKIITNKAEEYLLSPDFSLSTYEHWGIENNDNVEVIGEEIKNSIKVKIIKKI